MGDTACPPCCRPPVYAGEFGCDALAGGLCGEISDNLSGSFLVLEMS